MKNKLVLVYGSIIIVLTAVIIVALLNEPTPVIQQLPSSVASELPPNHPPLGEMNNETKPSKENVSLKVQQEIDNLKHAVEKEPSNISALMQLANFLFDAHQMSEAKHYYERVLQLDAKNTAARLELSVCYYHEQNLEKAISLMREILAYDNKNQDALYNLGSLYASMKNDAEAISWWERTIQANPSSELAKKSKDNISFLKHPPKE